MRSIAAFLMIKAAILFILFSLNFAAKANIDDVSLNLRPALLQEDNIALGTDEQNDVIRKALEEPFASTVNHISDRPEVPQHAQTSSRVEDEAGSWLHLSGDSFSPEQTINDGFASSPTSLNKHLVHAASSKQYVSIESNPLIESETSNTARNVNHNHHRVARHRPLAHGPQHDGHKHWCHRDCNNIKYANSPLVCASDGRLYSSLCELLRHSCRHNVHLLRRPASHCRTSIGQNKSLETVSIEEKSKMSLSEDTNPKDGDGGEVKIVELKGRCNRDELEGMKLLLLRQFGGDIGSIFKYFDTNSDQSIEAHELWPKREGADLSNNSLYAQAWDEHSNKCQLRHHGLKYHINGDKSKCWFFLDFAFEPGYPSNPCSLSHLILFDLKHPDSKFTFSTFQQAFQNVLSLYDDDNNTIDTTHSKLEDQFKLTKTNTRLYIGLGKTVTLNCLPNSTNQISILDNLIEENGNDDLNHSDAKCIWTRYGLNMAAKLDPHISVQRRIFALKNKKNFHDLTLHIKDAQLYLSGQFKCACLFNRLERNYEHLYDVQVLAEPRVTVRPQFQWSLPHSRISFECQYDHIDTSNGKEGEASAATTRDAYKFVPNGTDEANGQFGIQIRWLKENQEVIVDSEKYTDMKNLLSVRWSSDELEENNSKGSIISESDDKFDSPQDDEQEPKPKKLELSNSSLRASITMAASRLTLENLQLNDTGDHTCRVEVPINLANKSTSNMASIWFSNKDAEQENVLVGKASGSLLVQEQPITDQSGEGDRLAQLGAYLWIFHDSGISVYKVQNDDGQEMELVREINGHSLVSGEVDGNWNQLTFCGGLNSEQVVICEWSDNAVRVEVNHNGNNLNVAVNAESHKSSKTSRRFYVYVGQPNLNRIVVLDGLQFEIVAIINTEPQPRKLHLYKPNKVHLSKWVRRRLSPVANARWLAAIGTRAHSLKSTPADSRLYSNEPWQTTSKEKTFSRRHRRRRQRQAYSSSANQLPSALIQHDIWLLCYGQPLVVDPSGDESEEDVIVDSFHPAFDLVSNNTASNGGFKQPGFKLAPNIVQPFTPRISPPLIWSMWNDGRNKESKLRNRKSVHIIQSTFFPQPQSPAHIHDSDDDDADSDNRAGADRDESSPLARNHSTTSKTFIGQFKSSTVLTTHHIFSGSTKSLASSRLNRIHLKRAASGQLDLIQDLFVPPKPYSLELNNHHKIHYAYVTHYNEQRLFRVSMDEYRYNQEIDLENCDPINLMTTAQGLLVVQCRTLITHNLSGQLVLDQLTGSRIEFNDNIRAQESYLSPDNRYLISIYNNSTLYSSGSTEDHSFNQRKRSTTTEQENLRRQASIVYVQLVTVSGLKLQYEIKTSLEMSQCSFVWKDGYYAAIFVSTNHRDQQSEILSLRLADSRLELMARVPGVVSRTRHKEQLIISPELRLAALSTNQGTYVVDLEDNRVSQSLRHHQSPPTLLWV